MNGVMHIDAAKGLLVTPDEEVLFLRRTVLFDDETEPRWDIPGGLLYPGSASLQGLRRETREETGLLVPATGQYLTRQVIKLDSVPDHIRADMPDLFQDQKAAGPLHIIRRSFVVPTPVELDAVTLSHEHDDATLMHPDDALERLWVDDYLRAELQAMQQL